VNEASHLVAAAAAGALLGAFFFAGLWWTVRRGVSSGRAALWFLGSMVLRTCIVVLGFRLLLGGDWKTLLAGLAGFIAARVVVTRPARMAHRAGPPAPEADHAP